LEWLQGKGKQQDTLQQEEYEAAVYSMTLLQYMMQEISLLEQVKIL
jgi:hypothetical protein